MLDTRKLQRILAGIQGTTITKYTDLSSRVYLQQIRDALLGVSPARVNGNLAEAVYLQQIRNAILGVADGQYGSLSDSIYLQQILNAFNGVTGTKFGSLSENAYLDAITAVARPLSVPWYNLNGASAVVAYKPKGAASLAASYTNLANPGTNDCTVAGGAPGFAAATGWAFAGAVSSLSTGIKNTKTVICRFSDDTSGDGTYALFGISNGAAYFSILPSNGTKVTYLSTSIVTGSNGVTSGVVALSNSKGYLNGIPDSTPLAAYVDNANALWIGAINVNGVEGFNITAKIQALSAYLNVLTDAQVLAISTAMAAL